MVCVWYWWVLFVLDRICVCVLVPRVLYVWQVALVCISCIDLLCIWTVFVCIYWYVLLLLVHIRLYLPALCKLTCCTNSMNIDMLACSGIDFHSCVLLVQVRISMYLPASCVLTYSTNSMGMDMFAHIDLFLSVSVCMCKHWQALECMLCLTCIWRYLVSFVCIDLYCTLWYVFIYLLVLSGIFMKLRSCIQKLCLDQYKTSRLVTLVLN